VQANKGIFLVTFNIFLLHMDAIAPPFRITLEYYRGSARPGSNEVIHVKLRKRKSARFQLFSSFNRCDCGNPPSSRFCKGASSSRVRVWQTRRWGAHNPTIWFMGAEAVKSSNSLRACFYGRVSSIQKKLFTPIVFFFFEQFNFRHV